MSKRGNGLTAASYTPLASLPPDVADELLIQLASAGIAAYAIPASVAAETESTSADGDRQVNDLLYVDADNSDIAQDVLQRYLPGESDSAEKVEELDEDAIFAQIVAGFDSDVSTDWPEREDVSDDEPVVRLIRPAKPIILPDAERGDDEHFIPPPPPPLPSPEPIAKAAWLALFGGPLYLLLATMLGWTLPGWAVFLAVAAFLGGFVTLVLRMGDDPPRDDDDGAVV